MVTTSRDSGMRRFPERLMMGLVAAVGFGVCLSPLSLCAARKAKTSKAGQDDTFTPSVEQQVVEVGDTLWSITEKVTGKPWLWPKVWAMNPEITNPHWVYAGDIVRFVPPGEAPPRHAELVASQVDIPNPTEAAVDKSLEGPKVEVINTAPPPSRQKRDLMQRVFNGTFVTPQELAEAGRLTNALPDKILLGPGDRVYITFGAGEVPKPGAQYLLYRTTNPVFHPITGSQWGFMTEITGTATVEVVEKDVARARVGHALREVERGQYVTPLAGELMVSVTPTPATGEVEAVILAVEGGGPAAGEQKLVFIDKGKNDGLVRGNRLSVLSHGDSFTDPDRSLPAVDVAYLLVVDAKETTSTCLVVDSRKEIWPGDPVRSVGQTR
jgi:hypothetical protein